jgi:hypothetical protein
MANAVPSWAKLVSKSAGADDIAIARSGFVTDRVHSRSHGGRAMARPICSVSTGG